MVFDELITGNKGKKNHTSQGIVNKKSSTELSGA
jgi:hypothetical protein